MRDVPAAARRLDAALGWAPTGRRAVPVLVVLVVVANLVGVGTVGLLLLGLSAGAHDPAGGRAVIVLTALAYLAVALPLGVLVGLRWQRPTAAWLAAGRRPTPAEAAHALRLPVDIARVAAVTWLGGAVLVGAVGASSRRSRWSGCASPWPHCSVAGWPPASATCSRCGWAATSPPARSRPTRRRVRWASASACGCCSAGG
jgi:hypothetical protein